MPSTTTTYSFSLPTVGGDADDWGGYLNNNWTKIDAILNNDDTLKINLDNYTVDNLTLTDADVTATRLEATGEIREAVHTGLGTSGTLDIDPANGTIQTIAMTGNITISSSLANGEYVTLRITSVGTDSVTWPTMEWLGGAAPVLSAARTTWVELWNVGGTLYGAYVGASS